MIKVLLCDDEPWVLVVIKDALKALEQDITIVGEANSSLEALELCEYFKPDILITDINMSVINGLDLIERAKITCPNLRIIIISGYSKFEYAQRAIYLNVVGFLLKPIEENDLINLVKKCIFEVQYELHRQQNSLQISSQIVENLNFVRSKLIHNIIFTKDYMINSENYNRCQWHFSHYTFAVCIKITTIQYNDFLEESRRISINSFQEFIEINQKYSDQFVILEIEDQHTFLLLINQSTQHNQIIQHFYSWLEKHFSNQDVVITCGISSITDIQNSKENFQKIVLESFQASLMGFYDNKNTLYYIDLNTNVYKDKILDFLSVDELYFAITNSNFDKVKHLVIEFKSVLINDKIKCTPDSLKLQLWNLILSICYKFPANDSVNQILYTKQALFMNSTNINYLFSLTTSIFQAITSCLHETNINQDIIRYIQEYLKINYVKDITLEYMADLVGFHPNYLSKLFKQKTKTPFVEYLTHIRMERAEHLLSLADCKISEISGLVGFNDSKYFSKVFKKTYGMAPKEYRESKKP